MTIAKNQRKEERWQQKQTKREYKLYVGEVKATNDQQGIVEGILNAIGNVDYGQDRTLPGAFKRTLNNAYERKKADGDDYLWPYLFNHSVDVLPPGGIFDADEVKAVGKTPAGLFIKAQLNLDYQLGRDMYSSYKAKTLKKQSMGYICHQSEYVKAEVNGVMTTVRDLIEVEVLEGSGVVFPMNDLADVTGVKRNGLYVPKYWLGYSAKGAASGKTTWQLAPRSTKWDSGQATKDIEAWAGGDWSKVAECFFWIDESPPTKLADCKLPFVAKVGDTMQAVPQGIISGAGTIMGAMGGVDIPDGDVKAVKAKIKSYYTKMDMTPPWEDDSDGGKRSRRMPATKDFETLYVAAQQADCLEDWGDLIQTLTQSMLQIFGMGDSPAPDMTDALSQFSKAVTAWQEKAIECNLAEYIASQGYCDSYNNTPYVPYSLAVGSMSRPRTGNRKSGASFSQGNTDAIHGHVKALHDMADEQCKAMHDAADGLLDALSGLGAPSDPSYRQQGTTADDEKARRLRSGRKSGAEFSADNLKMLGGHVGGLHDVADTLHQMAEDLAENTGATTYVDPDGKPDPANQTDKDKAASRENARRKTQHSPNGTAERQEDLDTLLSGLKALATP